MISSQRCSFRNRSMAASSWGVKPLPWSGWSLPSSYISTSLSWMALVSP
jgi:hypothetical protein